MDSWLLKLLSRDMKTKTKNKDQPTKKDIKDTRRSVKPNAPGKYMFKTNNKNIKKLFKCNSKCSTKVIAL